MINSMMQSSFEDNTGIYQLTGALKNVNTCTSVVYVFFQPWFYSDMFWSF